MVGSAPIDDGWCGQSDHSGKIALALITFSDALTLRTHLKTSFKHVVGFESDGRATSCAASFEQLCESRATCLLLCFHVGNGNDARGVVMRSQAFRDFTILARV